MVSESVRQPRSIGFGAMMVGIGVFLYTACMFAFMVLPLGVETRAKAIQRRNAQI